MAVILVALPAIYFSVIQGEEQGLADRFGDEWRRYKAGVPALIPRRFRPASRGEWRREQWRRNREWRVMFWTAAALPALELWNALATGNL